MAVVVIKFLVVDIRFHLNICILLLRFLVKYLCLMGKCICLMEYAEYHLGQLKAKIAKLRTQLLEPPKVC